MRSTSCSRPKTRRTPAEKEVQAEAFKFYTEVLGFVERMYVPDANLAIVAAPGRVFDAWLNPDVARKWLFTTPFDEAYHAELDTRIGGRWAIIARRGGVDYAALGGYLEIGRPRRLVFTFAMPQFSPNSDRLTIEIVPDGAGCILTLTQAGIDIASELRLLPPGVEGGSEKGWIEMFDILAAALG